MIERIVKSLNELGINHYLINENNEESVELFFIKKTLDMKRRKNVTKYKVTVYRDFLVDETKMRGSSAAHLYSSMTEEEMKEALKDAYYAASFAKNPYYDIPSGMKEDRVLAKSVLASKTFEEVARDITEALYHEDTKEDTFINSAELFIYKNTYRIVNSKGIDVSYEKCRVEGEFIAQCTNPSDVETYQNFYYDDLDTSALTKKVRDTLDMTTARAKANMPPKAGEYKVILSGLYLREFMRYFSIKSSSYMVYSKYSTYSVGENIQGNEIKGDRLNMLLKAKDPYSEEGIKMVDRSLLEDGEIKVIHGASRFADYLGIEPTGTYKDIIVKEGTTSFDSMKEGQYLHVVNFSDFQMDEITGYFGGEIRLAFYSNGNTVIPVTGGSISGNMSDAISCLTFSKEIQKQEGYEGPYAVSIDKVTIGGE